MAAAHNSTRNFEPVPLPDLEDALADFDERLVAEPIERPAVNDRHLELVSWTREVAS